MEGDIGDLPGIIGVARKTPVPFDGLTMHMVLVYSVPTGAGAAEHFGVENDIDLDYGDV